MESLHRVKIIYKQIKEETEEETRLRYHEQKLGYDVTLMNIRETKLSNVTSLDLI